MPSLIRRTSTSVGYFFFLGALSLLLLFLDHRNSLLTQYLRNGLSFPAKPIHWLVNAPFHLTESLSSQLTSHQTMLDENAKLRQKYNQMLIYLETLETLKQENSKLHALLDTRPAIDGHVSGARIISSSLLTGTQTLILDKGRFDGIHIGQSVLDAHGLLGQIIRLDYFNSVVLPITDIKSAIPVEVVRTGEKGILTGTGSLTSLQLNNLPKTTHAQKNDLLVTSSLGQHFPAGYPIGYIHSVNKKPSEMFAKIDVSPSATIQADRVVFLLWPNPKPHSHILSIPSRIQTK